MDRVENREKGVISTKRVLDVTRNKSQEVDQMMEKAQKIAVDILNSSNKNSKTIDFNGQDFKRTEEIAQSTLKMKHDNELSPSYYMNVHGIVAYKLYDYYSKHHKFKVNDAMTSGSNLRKTIERLICKVYKADNLKNAKGKKENLSLDQRKECENSLKSYIRNYCTKQSWINYINKDIIGMSSEKEIEYVNNEVSSYNPAQPNRQSDYRRAFSEEDTQPSASIPHQDVALSTQSAFGSYQASASTSHQSFIHHERSAFGSYQVSTNTLHRLGDQRDALQRHSEDDVEETESKLETLNLFPVHASLHNEVSPAASDDEAPEPKKWRLSLSNE